MHFSKEENKIKKKNRQQINAVSKNLRPTPIFAMPAAALFGVFTLFPCMIGILTSFTDWNGIVFDVSKINFVGISNYIRLFSDNSVLSKIGYTVLLTVVLTLVENCLGLLLAVMMRKTGRFTSFVRCMIYLPGILSAVAMGFLWKAILNYVGVINSGLKLIGLEKLFIHAFDTKLSCTISLVIVHVWSAVGYYMIMYLSALQGISQSLYEAAIMDGANKWRQLINITIPLIVPQIVICLMLSCINNMSIYELVLTLTSGGPGTATQTLMFGIFEEGLSKFRIGYASALSVMFGMVLYIINKCSRAYARKRGVEQ